MTSFDYETAAQERRKRDKMLRDAAPSLLAALDTMLALFADHAQYDDEGHETAAIFAARAAISKAKGN